MEEGLRRALEQGTQVVTAHRRQARQIRYRYAAAQQAAGVEAWESPRVQSWDDWLVDLHREVAWSGYSAPRIERKLLTRFQEQVLWESILHAHGGDQLDDVPGAARQAATAWSLVQSYRLPDPAKAPQPSREVAAFGRWMKHYFVRCRDHSLVDNGRLADMVAPALRAGAFDVPPAVLLLGFDGFTPQQRQLLKTLEELGSSLDRYKGARVASQPVRVAVPDVREEYAAAARFVRTVLSQGQSSNTAILVPELARDRRTVVRTFDDILMPGSSLPDGNSAGRPYNLALGEPLHSLPIVQAALAITALSRGHLRVDELGELLRSPFLRGGHTEAPLRARFDAWLRRHQVVHLGVAQLPVLFERFRGSVQGAPRESATGAMFAALPALCDTTQKRVRASQWCNQWQTLLNAVGWPGDVSLDSGSFQTTERFRSLLDEIGGLDFLTGLQDVDTANRRLRDLCKSIQFQPQTPDLSVQIMLPEQATGLQFDHVWWCGVHAGAFPRPASPNPFLPRQWQHEYAMPGSSAAVELDRASRLATRLLRAAPNVVVSLPQQVDDHPVSVAPLVRHLPESDLTALGLDAPDERATAAQRAEALERFEDAHGPPVDTSQTVTGGTSLLGLQATCPFRAFGELRLRAVPLEEPQPGLDARERGSLMHAMLERLWRRLQSSDTLARLDLSEDAEDDYLQLQLFELADAVLEEHDGKRLQPLAPRFRTLERSRLIARAGAWLRVEAKRRPFTVLSTEQSHSVTLGGIDVRVVMDRFDQLESGAGAIIDYKTGASNVSDWFGERPVQPQLPLYALAQDGPVDVVAFGHVHPAKPGFKGIGRHGDEAPGLRPLHKVPAAREEGLEWDDLPGYWHERLGRLAEQFASGRAVVDPKDANACRYCTLPALCRIDAHASRALHEDEAGTDRGDGDSD